MSETNPLITKAETKSPPSSSDGKEQPASPKKQDNPPETAKYSDSAEPKDAVLYVDGFFSICIAAAMVYLTHTLRQVVQNDIDSERLRHVSIVQPIIFLLSRSIFIEILCLLLWLWTFLDCTNDVDTNWLRIASIVVWCFAITEEIGIGLVCRTACGKKAIQSEKIEKNGESISNTDLDKSKNNLSSTDDEVQAARQLASVVMKRSKRGNRDTNV